MPIAIVEVSGPTICIRGLQVSPNCVVSYAYWTYEEARELRDLLSDALAEYERIVRI